jgi:hypothetical protein
MKFRADSKRPRERLQAPTRESRRKRKIPWNFVEWPFGVMVPRILPGAGLGYAAGYQTT